MNEWMNEWTYLSSMMIDVGVVGVDGGCLAEVGHSFHLVSFLHVHAASLDESIGL